MYLSIVGVILIGLLVWVFLVFCFLVFKVCGFVGGLLMIVLSMKFSDGSYLVYKEYGVLMMVVKYKIMYIYGFFNSSYDVVVGIFFFLVFSFYLMWIFNIYFF